MVRVDVLCAKLMRSLTFTCSSGANTLSRYGINCHCYLIFLMWFLFLYRMHFNGGACKRDSRQSLFITTLWSLWKWRNAKIFKDSKEPLESSLNLIISLHDGLSFKSHRRNKNCNTEAVVPHRNPPCAFFDGAEQSNICGCGVHVIMDEELQYFIAWNGGHGTNSLAEARALAGLLAFCVFFGIKNISIFGDSKTMIDHVNGACHIRCPHLAGWLDRIKYLWNELDQCSIQHIYRSQNESADRLSKMGLSLEPGIWSLKISEGDSFCYIQDFSIPGI